MLCASLHGRREKVSRALIGTAAPLTKASLSAGLCKGRGSRHGEGTENALQRAVWGAGAGQTGLERAGEDFPGT